MPEGMPGGMPGGMNPAFLQAKMSDPELMTAFSNPKVMEAMQEIMQNPANMAKYEKDPEMMALMQKIMAKMGGGMPGGMPGNGEGPADAGASPEPEIDEID